MRSSREQHQAPRPAGSCSFGQPVFLLSRVTGLWLGNRAPWHFAKLYFGPDKRSRPVILSSDLVFPCLDKRV